jgi:Intein splicing domain
VVLTTPLEHNGAEQGLEDKETCSLSSIFLPNVESKVEFLDIIELLYKINKHSLLLPSHHKDTEKVVHKNMRMGINVTGVLQATPEQYSWLSDGYEYIRDFDKKYSEVNKMRPSIKLTTVQPSGCNVGNTLISTNEGLLYLSEIGDINGPQWQEIDLAVTQENIVTIATKFYSNGLSETIKITTSSGITIECTPEHKYRIMTEDGNYIWKKAKHIEPSDLIPYSLCNNIVDEYVDIKENEILDEHLAFELGCYAPGTRHKTEWLAERGLLNTSDVLYKIRRSPQEVIKSYLSGLHLPSNPVELQYAQELVSLSRYVGRDAYIEMIDDICMICTGGNDIRQNTEISETLNRLGYSDLRLDRVVSIEQSKALTYDIEVPENNCYIANSYISHNTLSLLPGVTSGVHPAYAQYLYRRIRIASSHPLVELCRKNGYPIEYVKNFDGTENYETVVVTFPFRYPEGTKLAKDMTAIDQLTEVRKLQTVWSDNAVSCTVYYKKEELPEIRKYLEENYKDNHKSLSFLLHSDHGFIQAPLQEITENEYNDLVSKVKPITAISMNLEMDETEECALGVCPVR